MRSPTILPRQGAQGGNTLVCHLVAFLTVAIWGTTFVWTKLLIINGLSPAQIFTLRFFVAYLLLAAFSMTVKRKQHKWLADSPKDELQMAALGVTGGSVYFLTENMALTLTTATNTSLIVCSCPLFAAIVIGLVYRNERFRTIQTAGSLMAFAGMVIVVLNGRFVLHLSPLGDALAFTACLSWVAYSLLLKSATRRYPTMFITRKVFFYGLLTILPYYIVVPGMPSSDVLLRPQVLANLLFLSCVASMACYLTWNWCLSRLGAVRATNWVYFNPIVTIIFAWWILDEHITVYFLIGSALILLGMFLSEKT